MTLKVYTYALTKLSNRQLSVAWLHAYRIKLILFSKRKWFPNLEEKKAYLLVIRNVKSLLSRKLIINEGNHVYQLKVYMLKLYKEACRRGLKFNKNLME